MRGKLGLVVTLAVGILMSGWGGIAWGLDRDPNPPPTDYWQKLGFLNVAHQGGEQEAPGNTLFAYRTSLKYRGADMIDMDAYMTADQQIVLTHDLDPCNTSNAPCGSKISEMTLAELRQLDFAYWFTPWYGTYYGHGDASKPHPYRGIATGAVEPPEGFTADDFKITTFDQVLDEFPTTPINIELKSVPGVDVNATAAAAAAALARHPGREKDVIINSFGQAMMDAFHQAAPNHLAFSASEEATLAYLSGTPARPTPVSLQPPDYYDLNGGWLRTVPVLRTPARFDGYSLIIWGSDHDPLQDTAPYYRQLITEGANGINTTRPGQLNQYLCEAGVRRPDGTRRCASQAPDAESCPKGTRGRPPTCVPVVKKRARLRLGTVRLLTPKRQRAGAPVKIAVLLRNPGSARLNRLKVCLSVPKAKRSMLRKPGCRRAGSLAPGGAKLLILKVRSSRKASGRVRIKVKVATGNGGSASKTVNPLYKGQASEGSNPLYQK